MSHEQDDDEAQDGLSDEEFAQFVDLLRRFAGHDLDQWIGWRLGTAFGDVWVTIARQPDPDADANFYDDLDLVLARKSQS